MSSHAVQFHPSRSTSSKKSGSVECRYCHTLGHYIKMCPKLAEKERRRREKVSSARRAKYRPDEDGFTKPKSTFRRKTQKKAYVVSNTTKLNNFAAFEESEAVTPKKKVTFAKPEKAKEPIVIGSWKKPLTITTEKKVVSETSPKKFVLKPKKNSGKRWADLADEESDGEDEPFNYLDIM